MTYENNDRSSLRLTEDGELASILSSLRPESVRMILWANSYAPVHRKRVMKMAALLSIDGKKHTLYRSQTLVYLQLTHFRVLQMTF